MYKGFYCNDCNLRFNNSLEFTTHKDIVHKMTKSSKYDPISQRQKTVYVCEKCARIYKLKKNLTEHNKSIHENLKLHKCKICKNSFNLQRNLIIHINTVHKKKIKKFSCAYCLRNHIHKSNLKSHLLLFHKKIMENLFDTKIDNSIFKKK